MPYYDWKNTKTGEVVTTQSYDSPPCVDSCTCYGADGCEWKRIYSFGLSSVQGAGASKARQSVRHN